MHLRALYVIIVSYDTENTVGRGCRVTENQILLQEVLKEMRDIREIDIVHTQKNISTRYKLGLTIEDYEDIIRSIVLTDYYNGPCPDHNPTKGGYVWIFKKQYFTNVLYVKIKIIEKQEGKKQIKCISCHIDHE